jgi:hypothetical protein
MSSAVKIEKSDVVDWEPLSLRFVPETPGNRVIADAVMTAINAWFQDTQQNPPKDVWLKYWETQAAEDGTVAAKCEFVSESAVLRLAKDIASRFPQYHRVILGSEMPGVQRGHEITWVEVPLTQTPIDGKPLNLGPLQISRYHVTIEQYFNFLDATAYVPECERTGACKFRSSQIASGGKKSGQWPVTHVAMEDATAFADWIGGRLPSEAELYAFFEYQYAKNWKIEFGNECWTSTPDASGKAVVLRSPFSNRPPPPIQQLRRSFAQNHWDFPFISFRVVMSSVD